MKKTNTKDDRTNFTIGVSSGVGVMKNRFAFALLGLLVGLVCGFKWANYNYRQAENAVTNARITKAAENAGANSNSGSDPTGKAPGQISDAIKKARENPNDFEAQRTAADLFMQIRRPEGALTFLQQANKLKPEDGEVMGELAGAYFFAGGYQESVSWARKALAKTPNSRPAKFYLASSLILSGQSLNEAEQLLNQVEADTHGASDDAKQALAQMRERLNQAKQGKTGDAKTTLQHGASSGGK